MKCSLENREDLITKYLMNELSDEESLHFEEHYFTCTDCYNELKAAEQTISLIAKDGIDSFQSKGHKNSVNIFSFIPVFSTRGKIVLAFASLFIIFIFYSVLTRQNEKNVTAREEILSKNQKNEQKADSLKITQSEPDKKKEYLIAELSGKEFQTNPYYEDWINENTRGENNIIEKVISPVNEKIFYTDITFKWIMKADSPVLLSILKNSEEKIFLTEIETGGSGSIIKSVSKDTFKKSGLYYWRIEDDKEVLYVGKFYFLKRK